jgi:hypothetical protein
MTYDMAISLKGSRHYCMLFIRTKTTSLMYTSSNMDKRVGAKLVHGKTIVTSHL